MLNAPPDEAINLTLQAFQGQACVSQIQLLDANGVQLTREQALATQWLSLEDQRAEPQPDEIDEDKISTLTQQVEAHAGLITALQHQVAELTKSGTCIIYLINSFMSHFHFSHRQQAPHCRQRRRRAPIHIYQRAVHCCPKPPASLSYVIA